MPDKRCVQYALVDVFTSRPFYGNPLAVVLDGSSLSTEDMQRITKFMNLSESVFVVPTTIPGADYHVRIFDPVKELPFAGHPTLGTCAALIEAGLIAPRADGTVQQQCGVGLVTVRVGGPGRPFAFRAPDIQSESRKLCLRDFAKVLSLPGSSADVLVLSQEGVVVAEPVRMDIGIRWGLLVLSDHRTLMQLTPNGPELSAFCRSGDVDGITIVAPAPHLGSSNAKEEENMDLFQLELRTFFPGSDGSTAVEDPVCGSANACVARLLQVDAAVAERLGLSPLCQYTAAQGTVLGRRGRIVVTYAKHTTENASDDDSVHHPWVSGCVTSIVTGQICLD